MRDNVVEQIEQYKKAKGMKIMNENGGYNCPLNWWKDNHNKYFYVWTLAKCILQIPATSAPSELVFSAISGKINKKRARLSAENANVLLCLKENQEYVEWE
jgi:ribosome biogenesis protein Nip4